MPSWEDLVPVQERETLQRVLDAAFRVHTRLGPGFLESVYQKCLGHALVKAGHEVTQEAWLPIEFDGLVLAKAHRADLVVDRSIIVEVKSCEALHPIHAAQVRSYLKASGHAAGLLLNFNETHLSKGYDRVANPDLLTRWYTGQGEKMRETGGAGGVPLPSSDRPRSLGNSE